MAAPATRAVIAALEARGGSGCARFVGGCVRNTLVGRPVDDIDIATPLTPDEVTKALQAAGLRSVPTGVEHGTVTALSGHQAFEITTLRRDVSTDGRRAVVAFTRDWLEDAARRDFRLNALYADPDGRIFDPTGHGLDDARAGHIVFVGEPRERIEEDHLRILRFFRFFAWFGRGEPDGAGLAACIVLKDSLTGLSAERVQKELLKLLAADDPRPALQLMAEAGVLTVLLPAATDLSRLDALVEIERGALHENDPELRLAALLPQDPAVADQAAQALRLSNAQRDRLVAAVGTKPPVTPQMTPLEARQTLYRLGAGTFADRAKLAWAAAPDAGDQARWRSLLDLAGGWVRPRLGVSGLDALAAGAPAGPMVGQALREVEDWWIGADFPTDRDPALERLKAVIKDMVR
jgi:poly(A) polymerase